MKTHTVFPRRDFIKTTAVATGMLAMASSRAVGANDRLRIGVIGCGGMGTGHLNDLVRRSEMENIQVVAVSDLFQKRLTRAKDICKGDAYMDYRKLLERKDIDAVLIATPDHWHSKISVDAMESGKHVYCEKPLTHTVEQALQTRNAVRRTKKVLQVGPNATGEDACWKAHQAIKDGRVGKVTWAQASYCRNARICLFNEHQKPDPDAGPDKSGENYVNWDMWLGHEWGLAPKIPWNPDHFFRFRKYFPYNGGVATDLLYHKLAPLLISVSGANGEYPTRVNANGGLYIEKDGREIPDVFMMTVDYPSEWSAFLVSTLTNDKGSPDRIYGKWGTIEMGNPPTLEVNGAFEEEFKKKNGGQTTVELGKDRRRDLKGNWLDAIREKASLACNAELGTATMVAIKMAVESYRQKRTMLWDAVNEKVIVT